MKHDYILYHYPLSPFSRKVRVALAEKGLRFDLKIEHYWERRREFLIMNPACQVPVLVASKGEHRFSDSTAICEYLDEVYSDSSLYGNDALERAEVRRLHGWFNNKFYYEVTKYILDEKLFKHLKREGEPRTECIRAAKNNIEYHLDYIDHLMKTRNWLAGDVFSMADITAACQLSVLDYFNDVPWERTAHAREWYALVKSRPSFRPLLKDRVSGFKPQPHYDNPDF